ncbi:hypothetical protein CR513_35868, partial [Mucuna pruriens]
MMTELCEQFKIHHHNSTPRPKANGAVVAANKNIKKIVQKMVVTYKDWHEMLPFALHGYRTIVHTSTRATPYSLVYGMEAVLPIEVEIPSLWLLMEAKLEEAEWMRTHFDQLNLIEEKRLVGLCQVQMYWWRMKRAFDKRIRPREFQEGDLVLKKILPTQKDPKGKWIPNYEGPYVVKRTFSGRPMILTNMDSIDLQYLVNLDAVVTQVVQAFLEVINDCVQTDIPGFQVSNLKLRQTEHKFEILMKSRGSKPDILNPGFHKDSTEVGAMKEVKPLDGR